MEHMPIEWIMEVPPVTRAWTISIVLLSAAEYAGLLNNWDFFYSYDTVFKKHQYHRLLTSFLYFGNLSLDLFLTLYLIVRHSRFVEEQFTKKRDFIWFLFVVCSMIIIYSSVFSNLYFLGSYLNDVLLFIWSRHNSGVQVSFLGLISLQAIYIPFLYLGIGSILKKDEGGVEIFNRYIVGIIIGHIYLFFSETYPKLHNGLNIFQPIWYWFTPQDRRIPSINDGNNEEEDVNDNDQDGFVGIRLNE